MGPAAHISGGVCQSLRLGTLEPHPSEVWSPVDRDKRSHSFLLYSQQKTHMSNQQLPSLLAGTGTRQSIVHTHIKIVVFGTHIELKLLFLPLGSFAHTHILRLAWFINILGIPWQRCGCCTDCVAGICWL